MEGKKLKKKLSSLDLRKLDEIFVQLQVPHKLKGLNVLGQDQIAIFEKELTEETAPALGQLADGVTLVSHSQPIRPYDIFATTKLALVHTTNRS